MLDYIFIFVYPVMSVITAVLAAYVFDLDKDDPRDVALVGITIIFWPVCIIILFLRWVSITILEQVK